MCLLAYYLLAVEDYNQLLTLVNKSTNPEYMALKLMAQVKINRADLAEKTLAKLRQQDEDNCLTILASTWLTMYKSGMKSTLEDCIT